MNEKNIEFCLSLKKFWNKENIVNRKDLKHLWTQTQNKIEWKKKNVIKRVEKYRDFWLKENKKQF